MAKNSKDFLKDHGIILFVAQYTVIGVGLRVSFSFFSGLNFRDFFTLGFFGKFVKFLIFSHKFDAFFFDFLRIFENFHARASRSLNTLG